eukprot:PhM_4_TR3014/c1_g2_i1/m.89431
MMVVVVRIATDWHVHGGLVVAVVLIVMLLVVHVVVVVAMEAVGLKLLMVLVMMMMMMMWASVKTTEVLSMIVEMMMVMVSEGLLLDTVGLVLGSHPLSVRQHLNTGRVVEKVAHLLTKCCLHHSAVDGAQHNLLISRRQVDVVPNHVIRHGSDAGPRDTADGLPLLRHPLRHLRAVRHLARHVHVADAFVLVLAHCDQYDGAGLIVGAARIVVLELCSNGCGRDGPQTDLSREEDVLKRRCAHNNVRSGKAFNVSLLLAVSLSEACRRWLLSMMVVVAVVMRPRLLPRHNLDDVIGSVKRYCN